MTSIGSIVLMPSGVARVITLNPPQEGITGQTEISGEGVLISGSAPDVSTAIGLGASVAPGFGRANRIDPNVNSGVNPETNFHAQEFASRLDEDDSLAQGDEDRTVRQDHGARSLNGDDLSDGEKQLIRRLESVDRAVRAEEEQHSAVAGGYGGPIQYQYVTGPDGKRYAVGGSVSVSTFGATSDEEHARAAAAISAAAISVQSPSSADVRVVQQANRTLNALSREDLSSSPQENQGADREISSFSPQEDQGIDAEVSSFFSQEDQRIDAEVSSSSLQENQGVDLYTAIYNRIVGDDRRPNQLNLLS